MSTFIPMSILSSQSSRAVLLIGIFLSFIHLIGLLISVYYLVDRLIEPDQSERSIKHVCTTALMCPFYRYVTGLSAISIQLVGSIAGFIINIVLTLGIIHRVANMLLIWLVGYVVGICGCIILFGIILNALFARQAENEDVSLTSFIVWPSLAILLALVYIFLWFIVFKSWTKIRRRAKHNQVFTCMEWKLFSYKTQLCINQYLFNALWNNLYCQTMKWKLFVKRFSFVMIM